jgi:hypothetical protein
VNATIRSERGAGEARVAGGQDDEVRCGRGLLWHLCPQFKARNPVTVPRNEVVRYCPARGFRRKAMKHLDERTAANLEVALEDACRSLPHGGEHSFRKKIAQKLLSAARHGSTTLGRLTAVAREAANDAMKRRSA